MKLPTVFRVVCAGSLVAALASLLAPSAQAAPITWDNNTSVGKNSWQSYKNWTPQTVPTAADDVTFNSSGVILSTLENANAVASSITQAGTGTLTIDNSKLLNKVSSGPYTLTVGGTGVSKGLILNAGSGLFTIGSATTTAGVNVVMASTQTWTNNSSGGLVLLNGLSAGTTGTQTLTIAGSGTTTFSGVVANGTGTFALTKNDSGLIILGAANTYTGATTISAGTLALGSAGSFANSTTLNVGAVGSSGSVLDLTAKTSGFHILSGQTLGGIGTVNITGATLTVDSGAHWAPGNSIGTNAVAGNLTLAGTSDFQLGNSTGAGTHASPYISDRSAVTGTLTLGGTLNLLDNAGANSNGSAAPGSYLLFTQTGTASGTFPSITNITGFHSNVVTSTSGSVFLDNYALAAAASTQTANVGAFHVGVGKTIGLTLNNTAAVNATYTETLQSNGFTSTTTHFSAAGLASGISGGGSGSGTLLVGVGTGLGAGVQSGSTLLAMQSNAVNSSGLGTTALPGLTKTITVTGNVFNGTAVWSGAGSSWGTSSQWADANSVQAVPGTFAGYDNTDTATFNGSGATTVNLDSTSPSLKTLNLSGASGYTIAQGTGGASLQFKSDAGDSSLTAGSDGHLIGAPVILASNLTAMVTGSSDILTLSGAISGSGALTKAGGGTLSMTGVNIYTGGTTVSGGTLLISSSVTGAVTVKSGATLCGDGTVAGAVTVESGGMLCGNGKVTGDVSVSGLLAPGSSIEKFTVDGDLTFANGSTFAYEMNSGAAAALAGDLQIAKGGGIGDALSIGTNVELTLTDLALGTGTFAFNTTLSLIQYVGQWNGGFFTYRANELIDGETFTDTYGNQWTIRYDASGGGFNFATGLKDSRFITLSNLSAIPETRNLLVLGCLIGSGAFLRIRRRGHSVG